MKYAATTLMGLLLLGVCSARTTQGRTREMDITQYREADYTKLAQESRREGAQLKAEEQHTQQWGQLRKTGSQQLRNRRQSYGNSHPLGSLPPLTDPIYIGSVSDQFFTPSVSHEDARFKGLSSAYAASTDVDTDSQTAYLTVRLKSAEISGNYRAMNVHNQSFAGTFNISLFGNVNFQGYFPYYLTDGDNVQLLDFTFELQYDGGVSKYANADFPHEVKDQIQYILLQVVEEKVGAELNRKLGANVLQSIRDVVSGNPHQDSVEKVMRNDINNAVNGIQQMLAKKGISSIELTSDDKEMVYNKLHAKIASAKLNGLQKFYLADNQVSKENSDKISAKLQLVIDRPTASAVVTIQESRDEDAPFQKINVNFDMEKLMAELIFEKTTHKSELNLRSFQTKINRIRPTNIEKFQGEVRDLIMEKLTDHMKRYVEQALDKAIMNEYHNIMNRGVLPPSQENRSAQKQR